MTEKKHEKNKFIDEFILGASLGLVFMVVILTVIAIQPIEFSLNIEVDGRYTQHLDNETNATIEGVKLQGTFKAPLIVAVWMGVQ